MLYSGALVRAGMGYASYADIAAAVGEVRAADAALAGARAEDGGRGRDGGFDDAVHVALVLHEQRSQFTQPAEQDQRQRPGDRRAVPARRKPGLSLRSTSMSVSASMASRCSGRADDARARAPRGSSSA